MCGISGVFNLNRIYEKDISIIREMNSIQKHRGPDDEGIFHNSFCVLGHRRLAIIDLSHNGHQPFESDDGRFKLVYNGEIYNYIELREELMAKGWKFRTKTDTEVLLKAYQQYGESCLKRFNGMFAFAVYDTKENLLFLARDRMGVKPLYYCLIEGKIYFASEIKALKAVKELKASLNDQSVFDYFVFNRIDVFADTFISEIKRLPKGHWAIYDKSGFRLNKWWDPASFLTDNEEDSLDIAGEKIEEILVSAVKLRMRSDVPVGSCLSGGVDSSIILGILNANNLAGKNYATFSAVFPGEKNDESFYVDLLQKRFGCQNHKTFPSSERIYDALKEYIYVHDEPTLNSSYYTQYEVMKLAKEKGVTVLLDGQGADEVFAGYHYMHGFNLTGKLKSKNYGELLKEFTGIICRRQDNSALQTFFFQLFSKDMRKNMLFAGKKFLKKDFLSVHIENSLIFNEFFDASGLNLSLIRHFQYKLEHLLHSEDRNSMCFSIEARVPYLDYRLVEYMFSVSPKLKIRNGETKYIEKKVLGKYTIKEILDRKDKIGFDTPQSKWMKENRWKGLLDESYRDVCERFPFIFEKGKEKELSHWDAWKVIQLNIWEEMFL
ncbi:MAG: asparagine synthase (glutamine-hydrolyzing) [Candidatus Omnitrophica bacterium]|nr:asparagine synthase (glutamine-hydrolyzing) [Candidatus Omnitrophota bacterium]